MTRVFIWKNNSPQEWEEISFSAFSKARRNGCFTGRFFVETVKMFRDEDDRIKRGYFETTLIDRRIRIITSSFEAWYQKQTHYVKISERSNENGIYREA